MSLDDLTAALLDVERELRHLAHDLAAALRLARRPELLVNEQASHDQLLDRDAHLRACRQNLIDQIDAAWVPVEQLCGRVTELAEQGLVHDAEERELLRLLGTHSVDARAWPYVAAALRAREEPNEEHFVALVMARPKLRGELRRAA